MGKAKQGRDFSSAVAFATYEDWYNEPSSGRTPFRHPFFEDFTGDFLDQDAVRSYAIEKSGCDKEDFERFREAMNLLDRALQK